MRHAFNLSLLMFFILTAQQPVQTSPQDNSSSSSANQAVDSLVSRLKGARAVVSANSNYSLRLSSVRAEGCILKYEITSEFEPIGRPASMDRPQDAVGTLFRMEDEWMVNLADLDTARVIVRNYARSKAGRGIAFAAEGGRLAISRTYQDRFRQGVWMRTQQLDLGYFPLRDEEGLEEVAESLRHAIAVCKNSAR
jgi:hypothetical protein